jgi:hypothetical protein
VDNPWELSNHFFINNIVFQDISNGVQVFLENKQFGEKLAKVSFKQDLTCSSFDAHISDTAQFGPF